MRFRETPVDLEIDAFAVRTRMACRLRRLDSQFGLESVDEPSQRASVFLCFVRLLIEQKRATVVIRFVFSEL